MATMNKNTRVYLLLLVVLGIPYTGLRAQQKDFHTWYEFELAKDIADNLELSGEAELRLKNNSKQFDRMLVTLASSYDLTGYMRAAAGYRMVYESGEERDLDLRYRIHADIIGRHTLSDVDLSARVRFQYGFEEFIHLRDSQANSFVNRIRLKAGTHIFGTRIGVFASAETWGLITGNRGRFLRQMRYSAGVTYSLGRRSDLSLRYILDDEFNQVNPQQDHIMLLGYAYSL